LPVQVNSRALHRFTLLAAAATFALLGAGGLVTSHGAGMAVPDWPNTFGYNMFFFPVSQWIGGIFYEHTHRLLASGVGLLTAILAVWLHGRKARGFLRWTGVLLVALAILAMFAGSARRADAVVLGLTGLAAALASRIWPRSEPAEPWLRSLGLAAFFAVVLQGVLGGLRVVLFKDQIGIFHATLAQLFFVLMCSLALFTSPWWNRKFGPAARQMRLATVGQPQLNSVPVSKLSWLCFGTALLILVQLILGATMRHQHAGLAIPDFPLAYGKVWPSMDSQSVAHYNQQRIEVVALNPITAFQIGLQMAHRILALGIIIAVGWCARLSRRTLGAAHPVARLMLGWIGLILLQALLGAATIWSKKAADVATAHVLVGALSLTLGSISSLLLVSEFGTRSRIGSSQKRSEPANSFGGQPSPAVGFK
jgi:cytochrome c oxidase assembly protein subunit 15